MKDYPTIIGETERKILSRLRRALKKHRSLRGAARALSMPKSTAFDLMQRHGINLPLRARMS